MAAQHRLVHLVAAATLVVACNGNDTAAPATTAPATTAEQTSPGTSTSTSTIAQSGQTGYERVASVSWWLGDALTLPRADLSVAEFSPDGSAILLGRVSAGELAGLASVIASADGAPLLTLDASSVGVMSAEFSGDGSTIVTAHSEGTVRLWDATTGAVLATLSLPELYPPIWRAALSPDGDRVAGVAGGDGTVTVWDVATQVPVRALPGRAADYSPDGSLLATASSDGVTLWDGRTLDAISTLTRFTGDDTMESVRFIDGGRLIVGGGLWADEFAVTVWDVETGAVVGTRELFTSWAAAFTPDGATMVLPTETEVLVLDARTMTPVMDPISTSPETADRTALSRDGTTLVIAAMNGPVEVWDLTTRSLVQTLEPGNGENVVGLAVSPDGDDVLVARYDGTLTIWHRGAPRPPTPTADRPAAVTTTYPLGPVVIDESALLRGDGFGPHRFGDPAADVEAWMTTQFGAPVNITEVRSPLTDAVGFAARDHLRWVTWPLGVEAVFSDIGPDGPTPAGVLQFVAWRYSPFGDSTSGGLPPAGWDLLETRTGITVGTPLAELEARYPTYTIEADGPCPERTWGSWVTVPTLPSEPVPLSDDKAFTLGATRTAEAGLRGHAAGAMPAYVGRLEAGATSRCAGDRSAPPAPDSPILDSIVLSPDSIDWYRIGRRADALLEHLVDLFGAPQQDSLVTVPSPTTVPATSLSAAQQYRYLNWHEVGLQVVLSDKVPRLGIDRPGALVFAGWTAGPRLQTAGGTRVGATVGDLEREFPGVTTYGVWAFSMASVFDPTAFTSGGLAGTTGDWDVVRAIQESLVANGADLAVTGAADRATTDALAAFAAARGLPLSEIPVFFVGGEPGSAVPLGLPLTPELGAALALTPPPDTPILSLHSTP